MNVKTACLALCTALATTGCSSFLPFMLPDERKVTETPWHSFDDARRAFDEIVPDQTSADDLRSLGFHPEATPNVVVLSYMDVYQRFVPNDGIRLENQAPGVQECVRVRERCHGWRLRPATTREKRFGNLVLDFFTFRRQVETTGWEFTSLVVMVDDRVVYKLWDGNPERLEYRDRIKPLGPLQDVFFVIDVALAVLL